MDADSTYHCTCRTCREETTVEGYDTAHEFFSDHADLGHRVEIAKRGAERTERRLEA